MVSSTAAFVCAAAQDVYKKCCLSRPASSARSATRNARIDCTILGRTVLKRLVAVSSNEKGERALRSHAPLCLSATRRREAAFFACPRVFLLGRTAQRGGGAVFLKKTSKKKEFGKKKKIPNPFIFQKQ